VLNVCPISSYPGAPNPLLPLKISTAGRDPVLPLAKRSTRIWPVEADDEIRLKAGIPPVNLFHGFDVAELNNAIVRGELPQRDQRRLAPWICQYFDRKQLFRPNHSAYFSVLLLQTQLAPRLPPFASPQPKLMTDQVSSSFLERKRLLTSTVPSEFRQQCFAPTEAAGSFSSEGVQARMPPPDEALARSRCCTILRLGPVDCFLPPSAK